MGYTFEARPLTPETWTDLVALFDLAMIRDPPNPIGMTTDQISGSPFDTYTWPGRLLLVLASVTPCVLAVGLIARWHGDLESSALFGIGLMAWSP